MLSWARVELGGQMIDRRCVIHLALVALPVASLLPSLFTLSFNGIADDEALTLAKKFNWKGIQAAVPAK